MYKKNLAKQIEFYKFDKKLEHVKLWYVYFNLT